MGDDIHFKLDGVHPVGASHHHKILVIDDRLAFCGGIDMTGDRWDTREHRDKDPGRRRPTTKRRYEPWHDATMAVEGAAARALGELARERWELAGGKPIAAPGTRHVVWPKELKPMFREVDVAISRTRGASEPQQPVREIEALFIDQIRRAKRFFYAENQYFASRKIGQAILERLAENDPPEFVIVNPVGGQGWLDDTAMTPARARLLRAIAETDKHKRFRIYSPVTKGGEDIYVHAKITIVDDELLRVGSANFNNRSMGLDSECDVTIDAKLQTNRKAGPAISAVLDDLLAEHLGTTSAKVRGARSRAGLIGAIEALRDEGRTLVPLDPGEISELEEKLAETEAMDPESAGEAFEPIARPGLLAPLRRRRSA